MKRVICACSTVFVCVHAALGVNVLVLSSDKEACDTAAVEALKAGGHKVSLGPDFSNLTGNVDLSGYDVVYLQCNFNYTNADMPASGQEALLEFVDEGGGVVTSEWMAFTVLAGKFQQFKVAVPVVYWNYAGFVSTTFTEVTPDGVLNKGLPGSFEFPLESYGGTESDLRPKCGATVYYDSATLGAGVVGWNYGLGRAMSISTLNGASQIADAEFAKLLVNAVSWAALAGGEPGHPYTADCDQSGLFDLFDFLCFNNAFNADEPYADCDQSGELDLFDFLCFTNAFNGGC